MIRTGLYQLSTRSAEYTPKLASTVIRPAVVAISGNGNWFSTNPKRRDDELMNKNYSDSFDESDALEKGKEKLVTHIEKKGSPRRLARYNGPIFRPLLSGGFDDFFSPFFSRDPFAPFFAHDDLMPVLRNFPRDPRKTILRTSPGYEIKESEGSYEIVVDVPEGVGASDMNVEVNDDMIHLSGERKVEEGGMMSETWFDKRFTIGTNVDTDNITANFKDGVLVLKAPKVEVTVPPKKTIAITEDPHDDIEEEVIQKSYSDAFDESDWVEAGKEAHKEPNRATAKTAADKIPESKQYDPLTSVDDDEKVGMNSALNTPEDISKQYDPLTSVDDDEKDGKKM
jgi:HSP20 family protein